MDFIDFITLTAKFFDFSNYALAGVSVGLCIALFRHHREIGWLPLAAAFTWPFLNATLRVIHGRPFFTYAHTASGTVNISLNFPWFYLLVVLGLVMLWSARSPSKQ
jgi:hypothetical protein